MLSANSFDAIPWIISMYPQDRLEMCLEVLGMDAASDPRTRRILRETPDGSAATPNAHAATTADCFASSTWPPTTASRHAPNHETLTTASALRANAIPRRSCAWHGGASTSCGLCNETTPATNP
jgi:hypothetical protein